MKNFKINSFKQAIELLEKAFAWKLEKSQIEYWFNELQASKLNFTDNDILIGAKQLANSSGSKWVPTLEYYQIKVIEARNKRNAKEKAKIQNLKDKEAEKELETETPEIINVRRACLDFAKREITEDEYLKTLKENGREDWANKYIEEKEKRKKVKSNG